MSELVVVTFKNQATAQEVSDVLRSRNKEEGFGLKEIIVAEYSPERRLTISNDGHVSLEHTVGIGTAGVIFGALLGGLVGNPAVGLAVGGILGTGTGALTGLFEEDTHATDFLRKIEAELVPDTSALAVVFWADEVARSDILKQLQGVRGKIVETTLSAKNENELRSLLKGKAA